MASQTLVNRWLLINLPSPSLSLSLRQWPLTSCVCQFIGHFTYTHRSHPHNEGRKNLYARQHRRAGPDQAVGPGWRRKPVDSRGGKEAAGGLALLLVLFSVLSLGVWWVGDKLADREARVVSGFCWPGFTSSYSLSLSCFLPGLAMAFRRSPNLLPIRS